MPNQNSESALEAWRERIEFLLRQLAITADPATKFQLQKQIEECRQTIKELEDGKINGNFPSNLPYLGVPEEGFFGRDEVLQELHQRLKQNNRLAICAVSGMGGIGKTELALQYAIRNKDSYRGGLCWLQCRADNLGIQLVNYRLSSLGLTIPDGLELPTQVSYCWNHWPEGEVLIIYDDVLDYRAIAPYLPPTDKEQFKVLMTSRIQPNPVSGIKNISLDVLDEDSALNLLRSLVGDNERASEQKRIDREIKIARGLCNWLGYLPLGLELVGSYLAESEDTKLGELWEELNSKKLETEALQGMEGELRALTGLLKAFQLSWQSLSKEAKELGYRLSLFAAADISWDLVEGLFPEDRSKNARKTRDRELLKFSLLQKSGEENYNLHPLIREFFIAKGVEIENSDKCKIDLCRVMVAIAKEISEVVTVSEIASAEPKIPHLVEVAQNLIDWVDDQNLIRPYVALGRFYEGQSSFSEAEKWRKGSVEICKSRLPENHTHVAISYNNLAGLYESMGRYAEAEPLYKKALEVMLQQLGDHHLDTAAFYNNLASLYSSMGRYAEAERLYQQALEVMLQQLGDHHPHVATSYNNLAGLYKSTRRYTEAESLYQQALEIELQQLGENHPDVATSYNNLAGLYESTGRYAEAESLYQRSLKIRLGQLGENHPDVATSYNNLAALYFSMKRYGEVESLYQRSLKIRLGQLGENHPHVATSYNNLAALYFLMGRYGEAISYYQQSLNIAKQTLGDSHPNTLSTLKDYLIMLMESPEEEVLKALAEDSHDDYRQMRRRWESDKNGV